MKTIFSKQVQKYYHKALEFAGPNFQANQGQIERLGGGSPSHSIVSYYCIQPVADQPNAGVHDTYRPFYKASEICWTFSIALYSPHNVPVHEGRSRSVLLDLTMTCSYFVLSMHYIHFLKFHSGNVRTSGAKNIPQENKTEQFSFIKHKTYFNLITFGVH